MMHKCLYICIQICSKWQKMGLRLNIGLFEHKMPLGFVLFTAVHSKWQNKSQFHLNFERYSSGKKQVLFKAPHFDLISITYRTIFLAMKSFAWVHYCCYLLLVILHVFLKLCRKISIQNKYRWNKCHYDKGQGSILHSLICLWRLEAIKPRTINSLNAAQWHKHFGSIS